MQSFHINSFSAAVILATLFMGVLGAFVIVPIGCIQWTWNALAPQLFALPMIDAWQAVLLYVAGACLLYIFGLVQIEIKSEPFDEAVGATPKERVRYLQERIRAKHKSQAKFLDKDNDPADRQD
jgi:hypothetical protein